MVQVKTKKQVDKKVKTKKTCKQFCKNVFLPERERVEIEFSKNSTLKYIPIKDLKKTNKPLANLLETVYLQGCENIYCQKSCKPGQKKWLPSFTKKRRDTLVEQGAISGCRDVIKEFPKYYKNV
jgi:hypothetical protein